MQTLAGTFFPATTTHTVKVGHVSWEFCLSSSFPRQWTLDKTFQVFYLLSRETQVKEWGDETVGKRHPKDGVTSQLPPWRLELNSTGTTLKARAEYPWAEYSRGMQTRVFVHQFLSVNI